MDRPFERIDLGDGDWWEVYTQVTRGMRRRFRDAAIHSLTGKLDWNGSADFSDPEKLKAALLSQPGAINLHMVDDGYLLHGTRAWSWPEPVSLEAIDALPDEMVEVVLERMRILYAEPGEEAQKKATGTY